MVALLESPESWLFVAIIAIILFGSSKLPELARSLGRSKAEFQKGMQEGAKEQDEEDRAESKHAGEPKKDAPQ